MRKQRAQEKIAIDTHKQRAQEKVAIDTHKQEEEAQKKVAIA